MSYSSEIDIKLPIAVEVEDPEVAPILQRLHNSMHILNSAVGPTSKYLRGPEFGDPLTDGVNFVNRTLYVPVNPEAEVGRVVYPKPGAKRWELGAVAVTSGRIKIVLPFAVVLEDPFVFEDDGITYAKVGIPPAIIDAEDATRSQIGELIYTTRDKDLAPPGVIGFPPDLSIGSWIPVGIVVDEGYVLLSWGTGGRG